MTVLDDTQFGGKANPGTKKDKRLKENTAVNCPPGWQPDPTGDGCIPVKGMKGNEDQNDAAAPLLSFAAGESGAWRGVLVVEGTATGDGREFSRDSLTWADPPLPLQWQKETNHGSDHDVTVRVGSITRLWRVDNGDDTNSIWGEGIFDLGGPSDDDAHEAHRRMGQDMNNGVSIRADNITNTDIEYVFPDAEGSETDDELDIISLLFAEPEKTIFHAARLRAATLCDIPAYVQATLHLVQPGEAAVTSTSAHPIEEAQRPALVASGLDLDYAPPASWFADPHLTVPTPVMVTDEGRVYGLASEWKECHLGYRNECVKPAMEARHDYFMTGQLPYRCDDGSRPAVGQITAGIGHASLGIRSWQKAAEHYDNTEAVVADVVVGNCKAGIWVAGAIRPGADPRRVAALRASGQVSPDWRMIGGKLRMVGLLTVNVSGFQVAGQKPRVRTFVAESGQLEAMIASGLVSVHPGRDDESELDQRALRLLQSRLADRVHRKG